MSRRLALLAVAVLVLLAGGYYYITRGSRAPVPPQTQAQTQPPPEVGVIEVRAAEVPLPIEFAGRVIGFRDVEVRPRIGGLLLNREFEEGGRVKEGQVLFRIDPAPYEVALNRAEAQLSQAQTAVRQAEDNLRRIEELYRRGVSTEKQRDDAQAELDRTKAGIQLAQSEVESARLNLSYTTVTAPVGGITAVQSPTIGTLVQAQQTPLTTITQLDPAYVSFSFTDEEGQAFRDLNLRRAQPISEKDLFLDLRQGTGHMYPQPGRIDIAAQRVDPQTGTIQARGVFPNPDGVLLPGQFVRVVIRGITLPDAIVVPERAVSQGPQGPSVLVVDANGTAQTRPLRLGEQISSGWVIREGLKAGERVIVDGLIRVRPGAPVRPVPATADTPSQSATVRDGSGSSRSEAGRTATPTATGSAPGNTGTRP